MPLRLVVSFVYFAGSVALAQIIDIPADDFEWVNLRTVAPSIVIDLRYATSNNIAKRPLYGSNLQPFLRAGVARKLVAVQAFLRRYDCGLKIWDAYRSPEVQAQLWRAARNNDYVADPERGAGSMHSWGVAVDATMVDNWARPISMPTDFDDFTPAGMLRYSGSNAVVRTHLYTLQAAMAGAGFYGLRTEWWHFTTSDWRRYVPKETIEITNAAALAPEK